MKKKGFLKKTIAYVLAMCMLALGLLVTDDSIVVQAGDSTRVWFYNSNDYENVYAYTWNAPNEALGGYPGAKATQDGSGKWYYVDVSYAEAFNIIFNDGTGDNQAAAYIQNGNVYVTGTDTTFATKEEAETALGIGGGSGKDDSDDSTRVWFYNTKDYENVYAYTWNAPDEALGGYPGTKATQDGSGKWYYVDVAYTGNFNIKFNNGLDGADNQGEEAYIQDGKVYLVVTDKIFATKEAAEAFLNDASTTLYFLNNKGICCYRQRKQTRNRGRGSR